MAHVAKYQRAQAAAMIRHWERENRSYSNERIDPARSHLNYGWSHVGGAQLFLDGCLDQIEQAQGRKIRKDAVVVFDWVVTQPPEVRAEDSRLFFDACFEFLQARYGEDNLVTAQVHMDETTPHLHYAAIPQTEDGRLCCKEFINRAELRAFHGDLAAHVEKALGYEVSILLDESRAHDKALSCVPQEKLDAARAAVSAEIAQETAEAREMLRKVEADLRDREGSLEGLEANLAAFKQHYAEEVAETLEQVKQVRADLEVLKSERASLMESLRSFLVEVREVVGVFLSLDFPRMRERFSELVSRGNSLAAVALEHGGHWLTQSDRERSEYAVEVEVEKRAAAIEQRAQTLDVLMREGVVSSAASRLEQRSERGKGKTYGRDR